MALKIATLTSIWKQCALSCNSQKRVFSPFLVTSLIQPRRSQGQFDQHRIYTHTYMMYIVTCTNQGGMFFHLIKELRNRCVHTHTSVFTNVLFTYCHRQMCSSSQPVVIFQMKRGRFAIHRTHMECFLGKKSQSFLWNKNS